MSIKEHSKIRLALIATYPEMSRIFINVANKNNIIAYDEYASFDDAVKVAKKLESKVDVILSRGGTAAYIRDNVKTPVVFIPITSFDVLQAVRKVPPNVKEAALFHYNRSIHGVKDIREMYNLRIYEYTFENKEDIARNVEIVRKKGIKTIIGGEVAVRLATAAGLNGVELSAGEDTINRAVEEAIQIVEEARKAYYQAARLEAAFNAITEGVVITNEDGKIIVCNPGAENILQKKYKVGDVFKDDVPDSKFEKASVSLIPQYDYLRKIGDSMINANHIPVKWDGSFAGMVSTFEDVTKIQHLEQNIRKQMHKKGFVAKYCFEDILTGNAAMETTKELAAMYAATDLAVLLEGESGTGKELFAQSIHNSSRRANGPFVAVNCAAIPEPLLESELFGYETGAFTGARKEGKSGLFELAHKGTIFLDEIGEMPIQLQTRLLRILQEKEVMRIGGSHNTPVDIRVISASNKNLLKMIESGGFRQDLYYRLNVLYITLPSLRNRKEDIELLCRHFLKHWNSFMDAELFESLLPAMQAYNWPGNVRELQNVAQRLSFLSQNNVYNNGNLRDMARILGIEQKGPVEGGVHLKVDIEDGLKEAVAQAERAIIKSMLDECRGDYDEVARRLKIGRTTLWRKNGRNENEEI